VDIPEAKNKAMDGTTSTNKANDPTLAMAASILETEYFFPGGGVWKPMTIRAATRQDAEAIHREKREPANTEPEKVGEETNNE
jgi:hypothetical protein